MILVLYIIILLYISPLVILVCVFGKILYCLLQFMCSRPAGVHDGAALGDISLPLQRVDVGGGDTLHPRASLEVGYIKLVSPQAKIQWKKHWRIYI